MVGASAAAAARGGQRRARRRRARRARGRAPRRASVAREARGGVDLRARVVERAAERRLQAQQQLRRAPGCPGRRRARARRARRRRARRARRPSSAASARTTSSTRASTSSVAAATARRACGRRLYRMHRSGNARHSTRSRRSAACCEAVTMREIERIFEVTDRLGIHREQLVIPLGAAPSRAACAGCRTARSRSWWRRRATSRPGWRPWRRRSGSTARRGAAASGRGEGGQRAAVGVEVGLAEQDAAHERARASRAPGSFARRRAARPRAASAHGIAVGARSRCWGRPPRRGRAPRPAARLLR